MDYRPVLDEIEDTLPFLSVEHKCKAISILRHIIETGCPADAEQSAMEKAFPREYDLIVRLARSMDFSDAYKALQRKTMDQLVKLHNLPNFRRLCHKWNRVALPGQQDFLEKFQRVHASLQSTGGVRFDPASVAWFDYSGDILAETVCVVEEPPSTYFINILNRQSVLSGLGKALGTMAHEQQHYMQMALGHAHHTGGILSDSPYKEDAEMLYNIFRHQACLPPRYGLAYREMPHERDSYAAQNTIESAFPPPRPGAAGLLALGAGVVLSLLLGPKR